MKDKSLFISMMTSTATTSPRSLYPNHYKTFSEQCGTLSNNSNYSLYNNIESKNISTSPQCGTDPLNQVMDVFKECHGEHDSPICGKILTIIISIQLATLIAALPFNGMIVTSFFSKPLLRKKNHNILLFNQAVAELVNLLVTILPNTIS